MTTVKFMVIVLVFFCVASVLANPIPGSKKHVKHRIHVPTKIHTIFVTKIVKVPEHHHHHHVAKKTHHHASSFDDHDNFDA